jgi:hypothetical protein
MLVMLVAGDGEDVAMVACDFLSYKGNKMTWIKGQEWMPRPALGVCDHFL